MTAPVTAPGPGQPHTSLAQAIGYANGVLGAVTTPLLSRPTPCRAWNLRMLLEHAAESLATLCEGFLIHKVAASPAAIPVLVPRADSAAALVSALRERAAALLDASAQADGAGPVTIGGQLLPVDRLRTVGALEVAVHAWDISQACGRRLPIPDEPATDLLPQAFLLVPRRDRYPLFAPPAPLPRRCTASDRLTTYLGRPARTGG